MTCDRRKPFYHGAVFVLLLICGMFVVSLGRKILSCNTMLASTRAVAIASIERDSSRPQTATPVPVFTCLPTLIVLLFTLHLVKQWLPRREALPSAHQWHEHPPHWGHAPPSLSIA